MIAASFLTVRPPAVDRFRRRLPTQLSIFLMLFTQLFLSFGQAAAASGYIEIELCSAHGNRAFIHPASGDVVVLERGGEGTNLPPIDSEIESFSSGPCCCCHAAGDPPLPTMAAPAAVVPAMEELRPRLYYHSPQPLFVWSAANPRAPPFLS